MTALQTEDTTELKAGKIVEDSEMKLQSVFNKRAFFCVIGLAALMIIIMPLTAAAQITTATIVGTVTDSTGAQVPSASVTARNVDTGLTRTVTSGEDGGYRLEFLPV